MWSLPRLMALVCVSVCCVFTYAQHSALSEHLRIKLSDPDDRVYLAQFNDDGTRLLIVNRKTTQIWSADTGKLLVNLEGADPFEAIPEFRWQPGGSKILQYDSYPFRKSDAIIWDGQTGKRLATLTEERGIIQAEWNVRGDRILTVGNWMDGGIGSRFTFSVRDQNGMVVRTGRDLTRQVHSILFSKTGDNLIISYKGKEELMSIRVYEANSGVPTRGFDHDLSKVDPFTYAIFAGESPNGKFLCAQIELSKGVTCWRSDSDSKPAYSFLDTKETGDTHFIGFSADSKKLAILRSRQRRVEIADTETGRVVFHINLEKNPLRFARAARANHGKPHKPSFGDLWSSNAKYFVTTDIENEVGVWDLERSQQISKRPAIWNSSYDWFVGTIPTDSEAFSFNLRNELLLSVSARTAKIWNPSNGQLLLEIADTEKKLSRGTFQRYVAQWSPNGKYLLTVADQNKTLILWAVND